jgi:hypothetical protein
MKLRASRAIVHLRDFDSQKMLKIRNTTYYSQLPLSLYPLLSLSLSLSLWSPQLSFPLNPNTVGDCRSAPCSQLQELWRATQEMPPVLLLLLLCRSMRSSLAQKALADFPLSSRVQDHCKMQLLPRGLSALVLGCHWSCAATASADSADACMR